jgi:hypothetical protein
MLVALLRGLLCLATMTMKRTSDVVDDYEQIRGRLNHPFDMRRAYLSHEESV